MTPIILFITCLGFLFCSLVYRLRYKIARKQNWHLFFFSMSVGGTFLVVAYAINDIICRYLVCYTISGVAYHAAISSMAIALASVCGYIANKIWDEKTSIALSFDDDLSLLLLSSLDSKYPKLIQLTLDTRKVYIGFASISLEPSMVNESFVTIMPMFSGHRRQDDLSLHIDNDYSDFWGNESEEFDYTLLAIVIPRKSIVSANIFNMNVYTGINSGKIRSD